MKDRSGTLVRLRGAGILLLAALGVGGCEKNLVGTDASTNGFLAVVTQLLAQPGVSPQAPWTFRLTEVSGTLGIDEIRPITPGDTLLINLPPASYTIRVSGLPTECFSRSGTAIRAVIFEPKTTTLVRWNFECAPLLTIRTGTDGYQRDEEYVYRVLDPDEREVRLAVVGANDTVVVDGIDPGTYTVELGNVAPNCALTNDGGRRQAFEVGRSFSRVAFFRVTCSDPAFGPRLLHLAGSYNDTTAVAYFEVFDPGSSVTGVPDVDRFEMDITDCNQTSLLAVPRPRFQGLRVQGSRVLGADTARIIYAFPLKATRPSTGPRCIGVRVMDFEGNTTQFVERRLGSALGLPPERGDLALRVIRPQDPTFRFDGRAVDVDGDLVGTFLTFTVEDGTIGAKNGLDETWILNAHGFLGPVIPDLRLAQMPFPLERLLYVTILMVDRAGNVTELRIDDIPETASFN